MRKLLLWLVMVAAMVAAILGGTAAFLYSRTGADKLPQEAVTFGEQELTANGWDWTIPPASINLLRLVRTGDGV